MRAANLWFFFYLGAAVPEPVFPTRAGDGFVAWGSGAHFRPRPAEVFYYVAQSRRWPWRGAATVIALLDPEGQRSWEDDALLGRNDDAAVWPWNRYQ